MKEFWLRYYMRYQAGFAWTNMVQTKDLYVNVNGTSIFTVGFHWADNWGIQQVSQSRALYGPPGWQSIMPSGVGDGLWHFFEIHVKMDTNGANGVSESWVDGQRVHSAANVNWGTGPGWSYFAIGSNQCCVASTTDVYSDFDDFAISTTGYIGPISGGGSSSAAPTAPLNVRIIP